MQGMRNRASWCGTMLRMMIEVVADVSRGLRRIDLRLCSVNGDEEVTRRASAGPRSCGRLASRCW
jgi:hypothetical protein